MSLPTIAKTWQFKGTLAGVPNTPFTNQLFAAGANSLANARSLLRRTKDCFIGFATSPWTVIGSSNSVAAGMDGVDRWAADANLVWTSAGTTTVHGWIVLQQASITAKYQVCLSLDALNEGSFGRYAMMYFSPSLGFGTANGGTDGSTTARPTALDEVPVKLGTTSAQESLLFNNTTSGFTSVLNVMQSTDGQTRVIGWINNKVAWHWEFGKLANVVGGWSSVAPYAIALASTNGGTLDANRYADTNDRTTARTEIAMRTPSGTNITCFLTGEAWGSTTPQAGERLVVPNDVSLGYTISPVGMASETAGGRGRHGSIPDLFWGSTAVGSGSTYPNDAARLMMQFGHNLTPWDASVVVTA